MALLTPSRVECLLIVVKERKGKSQRRIPDGVFLAIYWKCLSLLSVVIYPWNKIPKTTNFGQQVALLLQL